MTTDKLLAAVAGQVVALDANWLRRAFALADLAGGPTRTPSKRPEVHGGGSIAVLPIRGVISQRRSIWQEYFGGTDTEGLAAAFSAAINSPRVSAVVLSIDSPGGTINGVPELAEMIRAGAKQKRVVVSVEGMAASAAYWLAAAAGKGSIYASPSSEAGSVGVFRVHEDLSQMLAAQGIKITFLAVPEYKVESNPYEPLSQAGKQHHMEQVRAAFELFAKDVARGRGWSEMEVPARTGRGRMFNAAQAQAMGLVDGIKTLPQVLQMVGASGGDRVASLSSGGMKLEAELAALMRGGERSARVPANRTARPSKDVDRRIRVERLLRGGSLN